MLLPEKAKASNFFMKIILAQATIFFLLSCSYSNKDFRLNDTEKDLFSQQDSITLNGTVIKNYYLIKNRHKSAGSEIEALFWTNKDGLIAYQYRDETISTKKRIR
jgi:hypothetical protein